MENAGNSLKKDEGELEKEAVAELMKEAKRGKEREKTMGSLGWQKCPIPRTNKVFLQNMLKGTLRNKDKQSSCRTVMDSTRQFRSQEDPTTKRPFHASNSKTREEINDKARARKRRTEIAKDSTKKKKEER